MADNQEDPYVEVDEEKRTKCWLQFTSSLTDLSHVPPWGQDRLPEEVVNALDAVMEDYRCNGPTVASQQLSMLIQAGIPDCWRGQLWELFLASLTAGYNREIRARRYKQLAAQISDSKSSARLSGSQNSMERRGSATVYHAPVHLRDVEQVEKDLHRTWSPSTIRMNHLLLSETTLRRVLLAYAQHNPKIGYCQGMNFLAGMLLLYLPEEAAFWTLVDIVEKYLEDYFLESMMGVVVDQLVCRHILQHYFPLVTSHAEELQVDLALVSTQWLLPAFVNVLPKEAVLRVWDLMLSMRSPCVLFRVLLMVFDMNVRELLNCKDSLQLWTLVVKMPALCTDVSHLVDGAMLRFRNMTSELIQELRAKYKQEVLEKSLDSGADPAHACTPWLQQVPKHPNITVEVDLESIDQDLDETFFAPLAEQAEKAAWSVRRPCGTRSSQSEVEVTGKQQQVKVSCADAVSDPLICDDDAPENSPMTIRRQQKDAISQLVPAPCGTVEQPETECGNVPESSTARNGSHPAGDGADASRADVLSKPTLATQLVLGCYVATQKAAGGLGRQMKGKLMKLHALERAVLSQQQQLMQIRSQTQRVMLACRKTQKNRAKVTRECSLHQQAEKRHRSDAQDLKGRIEFTKALGPECEAELERADQEYDEEQARSNEIDDLLQTLARRN